MKKNILFRLMLVLGLAALTPSQTDAFNFGSFFKKAVGKVKGFVKKHPKILGAIKKVAQGPLGQMAIQAGGAAISQKFGPQAGQMFQSATDHLHKADYHEDQADQYDQMAADAEDQGDSEMAQQHRTQADYHRGQAAHHRRSHEEARRGYEEASGSDYESDYHEHVVPHLEHHARNTYPEDFEDAENDEDWDSDEEDSDDGDYDDEDY